MIYGRRNRLCVICGVAAALAGRIVGDLTHTVLTARGPRSRSRQMGGRIGKPGEPAAGGHGLWLIEGDKLIALRTFDAGGFKAEIEFSGSPPRTCRVRALFARARRSRHPRAAIGRGRTGDHSERQADVVGLQDHTLASVLALARQ